MHECDRDVSSHAVAGSVSVGGAAGRRTVDGETGVPARGKKRERDEGRGSTSPALGWRDGEAGECVRVQAI